MCKHYFKLSMHFQIIPHPQESNPQNKRYLGMACDTQPLKKLKKQGEMLNKATCIVCWKLL